ncbi:MAG: hypothetical protein F6K00_19915 [Leptolyngbya sp. SIOISBB]|nr:hypothetical protein [Leptolyngbya sp. SIOISBB]
MAAVGQRACLGWLLVAICWLALPAGAIAFPQTCFIDQARHLPNGAAVTVTGNVTVPSGTFGSANLDAGFAIQDVTGGIYVTTDTLQPLRLGETVQVTGQLQDDGHGQRMLRLTDWYRSQRPLLPMSPLLASAEQAGKILDGQLVTVKGEIVKPLKEDAPYGDRLWIQDETGEIQIYIPKSTGIAPEELLYLEVGQKIVVTGLSSQFDDNDEVMPRSRADIVAIQTLD